jgi:pyruvate dehydrogenase E2 component (dihydrolipoamide acetyltransferase)
MSNTVEIKVPDIGDFKEVEVIEVLVSVGDTIKAEQSLITVESDKASMEIPASTGGVVKSVSVKVGDKIAEGTVLLVLESAADSGAGDGADKSRAAAAKPAAASASAPAASASAPAAGASADAGKSSDAHSAKGGAGSAAASDSTDQSADAGGSGAGELIDIIIPDIGDFADVSVIEVMVAEGDSVAAEQSLITVETDKASMEIPSSAAGVIKTLKVKVGDKVSKGSVIMQVQTAGGAAKKPAAAAASAAAPSATSASAPSATSTAAGPSAGSAASTQPAAASVDAAGASASGTANPPASASRGAPAAVLEETALAPNKLPHASPSVRKFARELGANLAKVPGTGRKNRITEEDVRNFVKQALASQGAAAPAAAGGGSDGAALGLIPWPKVDFAKFGPIDPKPLSRIKKLSGANLHRNWVMIPHVTNNDVADITDLEALRVTLNKENEKAGIKVTMLAFLIKAVVAALKKFPEFNASLDGDTLVYKQYYNIGFAADTPNGLVVPVIRDADKKGIIDLANETSALAKKARDGKISPADMQGGCFSISSLGGIGGTSFTPIINAPEVAILGVSRSSTQPVWDGKQFVPRLQLPLSLSYDHRVIDGALAARFNAYLAALLADFRRIAL